jgi:hypothetical protein
VNGSWSRHVSGQLARYCDGQLGPADTRAVETHLAACARCRAERNEILFAARLICQLDVVRVPPPVWDGIAHHLDTKPVAPAWNWQPLAAAAAVLLVVAGGAWFFQSRSGPWAVERLANGASTERRMDIGDWIDTADGSRARITVGSIGTVEVERGSRVQLGETVADRYRLSLAHGTISARIAAPPRLFFVETPASTVVDLGCAYTVQVDDTGTGNLQVTEGWAALEWKGRESLVPAGALCRIQSGVGPGTPVFEDAPAALQQAVAEFDAGGGTTAVDTILAQARVRDTLTLWHLLSRVQSSERGPIYDRIAELTPVPSGVDRERVLALDAATLTRWREELAWTW